jgi:thymidylate synthase
MWTFQTITDAFEYYYEKLDSQVPHNGTKAVYNQMFKILDTSEKIVQTDWRKFSQKYAEQEWEWYLSKDRSAEQIAKVARIWYNHMDERGYVNSNYGWQWSRNNQIDYVVNELKRDKYSRRALLTIYDGKEHDEYAKDTPCTLNIQFYFTPDSDKLHMTVLMRSNDLWFGFCNDAYCFLKLHELVSQALEAEQGFYTHYAQNLHIYERHYNKQPKLK